MSTMSNARIVLVVKNEIQIEVLENYKDGDTATIWVRVGSSRRNSLVIGGVYREHQQLGRVNANTTRQELMVEQEGRWTKIVKNWCKAGRSSKCIVLGDMNLDFLRWQDPDQYQVNMVELVQQKIETIGFTQLVTEHTRSWRDQTDSLLDHIWVNCPSKVVNVVNKINGASDHILVEITVATKDLVIGGYNIRKRC